MDKQELVNLCKSGDKHALSVLYKTYAKSMKNICLSYIHDNYVADDILHDGFIIIITSINQLKNPDKLESWMSAIIKNLSIKYLNKQKGTISLSDLKEEENPIDNSAIIDSEYETILELIDRLPKGYKTVFKHAVLEGMSHKEIGDELGINEKSSASQLARAKKILRDLIQKRGIKSIIIGILFIPVKTGQIILINHQRSIKPMNIPPIFHDKPRKTLPLISSIKPLKGERKDSGQTDTIRDKSVICHTEIHTHSQNKKVNEPEISFNGNTPTYCLNNVLPDIKFHKRWAVSLSYYHGSRFNNMRIITIPGSITSGKDEESVIEKINQHVPFVISLALQKHINTKWSITTGLQYARVETDIKRSDKSEVTTQTANYVNIPLKVHYNFFNSNKFTCYISSGITINIPLNGKHFVQGSILSGAGLLYKITPDMGLFIDTQINYYLKGNQTPTIWKEHPLEVTFPIGVSYSW